MKKLIIASLLSIISIAAFSQEAKKIKLEQIPGEFKQTELTLKAGKAYIFEVTNEGVDHEVGFVIAPKGTSAAEDHVQASYLSKAVKDGESAKSKTVVLEKGEYEFFCPLNPTPRYTVKVK